MFVVWHERRLLGCRHGSEVEVVRIVACLWYDRPLQSASKRHLLARSEVGGASREIELRVCAVLDVSCVRSCVPARRYPGEPGFATAPCPPHPHPPHPPARPRNPSPPVPSRPARSSHPQPPYQPQSGLIGIMCSASLSSCAIRDR